MLKLCDSMLQNANSQGRFHNPKVGSSILPPATNPINQLLRSESATCLSFVRGNDLPNESSLPTRGEGVLRIVLRALRLLWRRPRRAWLLARMAVWVLVLSAVVR